jgi:hypothetical protein
MTLHPAPRNLHPECGTQVPAEDRNRTSPFPYGGHRFEFRAVGSTQNVSFVNTVLCALTAEVLTVPYRSSVFRTFGFDGLARRWGVRSTTTEVNV